jgi:hypothetical protein
VELEYKLKVVEKRLPRKTFGPRRRQEDNIKMDLREIGWGGVYWMHMAQDRDQWWILVNTVMKLQVQKIKLVGYLVSYWNFSSNISLKILQTV